MKNYFYFTFILLFSRSVQAQTENFWVKKNDFGGLKRERAVSFSIGDYGYIATGVDTAEVTLKDLWQYNPSTDSWAQKADLPGSARRDAVAFSADGKGYVGTGINADESLGALKLKDFWAYDPTLNTWSQVADYPGVGGLGLYFATAFELDSKGYVCGGKVGPNSYTNQLWEYKPSLNQWTQRTNFPGGVRYQLASFSVGYYGYVGLGANQDVFKKDFWKYNAGTNQWTAIADLPASERGSCVTFSIGNRGFVCMGSDGGILDDLWEYIPEIDYWVSRAPYGGSERKNAVGFVVNGKAYVGTGKGYSGKKAGMEEYNPYLHVGVSEFTQKNVRLFPNPSVDYFRLDFDYEQPLTVAVVSTSGEQVIRTKDIKSGQIVSVDALASGTYVVYFFDEQNNPIYRQQLMILNQ
jgi:N-acetylneuraminic acid mutarotase